MGRNRHRQHLNPETALVLNRLAPVINMALRSRLGNGMEWAAGNFQTVRDLTDALGYPATIDLKDYYSAYRRFGVAKRIVEAYPEECWRKAPYVYDEEGSDSTEFEDAVKQIDKDFQFYARLRRADLVAGIGRYGVLLIGADAGENLTDPLTTASELLFLQPYREERATIKTFVTDNKDPRYGLPAIYTITTGEDPGSDQTSGVISSSQTKTVDVHWSRIIHIPDNCTESDVFGTPRLECAWNNIIDIFKVIGGSAEMFWRGAFPGIAFQMDKDAVVSDTTKTAMDEEIQKYIHGLERYLKLQGTQANQLSPQVASPADHADVQLTMLSVATKIPKRILMGSERGELASSQDESSWFKAVETRQGNFCEPVILRPVINRLVKVGLLPPPKNDEYEVEWPELEESSPKDIADTGKVVTDSLVAYADSSASQVVPKKFFLVNVLGWTPEQADQAEEELQEALDAEQAAQEAEAEGTAEEEGKPNGGMVEKEKGTATEEESEDEEDDDVENPKVNYDPSQLRDNMGRFMKKHHEENSSAK